MAEQVTGGSLIARMLRAEGVDVFFGIVDGTYTQLFAHCVEQGMKMYSPRHEAVAAHMAGAYARLTGRLGVCIASNGPGVANMLPGVAVENGEGNRVLLLTSCRRTGIAYPDRGGTYQCFDHVAVIRGMSKWSQTVASPARLAELLREALRHCFTGRAGVVHLDVPENIINGFCDDQPIWPPSAYRATAPLQPQSDLLDQAAQWLMKARLPLVHAGAGVIYAQAWRELEELLALLHSPLTTSWSARGVISEDNDLVWPMIHIDACTELRNTADLVLCIGSEVGETDWWGKPPYWAPRSRQRWIQIDLDPARIGRTRPVDLGIVGDAKEALAGLLARLRPLAGQLDREQRAGILKQLEEKKRAERAQLDQALENRSAPMVTAHVPVACQKVLGPDAIVVLDGGNTAVWGHFYTVAHRPNSLLSTAHFGHLGAGVGQAIGAAVAYPDRPVYCIIGDGAMGYNVQEIETAVRYGLRPIYVVCSDRQWGMVKINQMIALQSFRQQLPHALGPDGTRTIETDFVETDWAAVAQAMGAYGERVAHPNELESALQRARESGRCSVIHVDVDPVAHLFAPGLQAFKDMHQEPAGTYDG
ncbi:MAG: thiamine pyrophosphate-binding protein [Candidatus Binatia bacterium]|nr:thiamine pyrophosphate-binding protein [Candidatus Binatia bacterium]